ncbi:MAG: hypothetical protein KF752_02540 [Pirellulaceae bacterium]|nr:hypothetical protein [Pirellulaceae bacterium]
MTAVLQQTLAQLPQSGDASQRTGQLSAIVDSDLPLQSFLEQLLPLLADLLGAQAAVAWMKIQGAVFGVRYRMEQVLPSVAQQKKHERLVQFAWYQKKSLMIEPAGTTGGNTQPSGPPSSAANYNPTGHRLLFAPILHLTEPIALLEIVLPPQHAELSVQHKQLYLRAAELLADKVYLGLKRRMAMPQAQLAQAHQELTSLGGELQALQSQIRLTIDGRLAKFHGWSFGSLTENQQFAKLVHQLVDSHGLRVVCQECQHPAILRCLRAGNAKNGVFVFDHYLETGRTFHGGTTTIPRLTVITKPARRSAVGSDTVAEEP